MCRIVGITSVCRTVGVTIVLLLFGLAVTGSRSVLAEENAVSVKKIARNKTTRNVAILVFEGVELLDFTGPAEVFIVAERGKAFRVYTVAESTKPIRTIGGITVVPEFSVNNAPQPDILVVPGGNTRNVRKSGVLWLQNSAKGADIVMSVCMGAFLLADAGLLDGAKATTHHWGIDSLKRAAPKCEVVKGCRLVDNGKIITTAGVTAGIDGALHIVERIHGETVARWVAEQWMEYRNPNRDAASIRSSR